MGNKKTKSWKSCRQGRAPNQPASLKPSEWRLPVRRATPREVQSLHTWGARAGPSSCNPVARPHHQILDCLTPFLHFSHPFTIELFNSTSNRPQPDSFSSHRFSPLHPPATPKPSNRSFVIPRQLSTLSLIPGSFELLRPNLTHTASTSKNCRLPSCASPSTAPSVTVKSVATSQSALVRKGPQPAICRPT